jgi:sialic acid synthase SpsE
MATALRELTIASRKIGDAYAPFVIPEIGINHGGDIARAIQMIDDVADDCADASVLPDRNHPDFVIHRAFRFDNIRIEFAGIG